MNRLSTLSLTAALFAAGCSSATAPAKPSPERTAKSQSASSKPAAMGRNSTKKTPPDALAPKLCRTNISNPPKTSPDGYVTGVGQTINVSGVPLLVMPATKSCLSSGYGFRKAKLHKGIDYFSKTGGDVLAAGDGVIIEALRRTDYGNMVLIDHGDNVYTRYAHLASFGPRAKLGGRVKRGQALGPIGGSGSAYATHLHFEILLGDYATAKKSFGLVPVDPFST